jgi:hypothetical protein
MDGYGVKSGDSDDEGLSSPTTGDLLENLLQCLPDEHPLRAHFENYRPEERRFDEAILEAGGDIAKFEAAAADYRSELLRVGQFEITARSLQSFAESLRNSEPTERSTVQFSNRWYADGILEYVQDVRHQVGANNATVAADAGFLLGMLVAEWVLKTAAEKDYIAGRARLAGSRLLTEMINAKRRKESERVGAIIDALAKPIRDAEPDISDSDLARRVEDKLQRHHSIARSPETIRKRLRASVAPHRDPK